MGNYFLLKYVLCTISACFTFNELNSFAAYSSLHTSRLAFATAGCRSLVHTCIHTFGAEGCIEFPGSVYMFLNSPFRRMGVCAIRHKIALFLLKILPFKYPNFAVLFWITLNWTLRGLKLNQCLSLCIFSVLFHAFIFVNSLLCLNLSTQRFALC